MTRPPLAEQYDLSPHPEGGWFRETYRSETTLAAHGGTRAAATGIYFLLHPGEKSAWHVVRSDELWFWHGGGRLTLRFGGDGEHPVEERTVTLGVGEGDHPQVLIPAGVWQAAEPADEEYVLVSCVVAPGFDFADFRLEDNGS
ncbi:cupin domain-containing protein [Actinoplanes sp. TRM 88003]|uniref:Cupin domain-containing protein n=1 Tax=Paractinoplanes aksuensis TaxID=2939490 RepID=A0ABT1DLM5_9ACTN|nr:cupin domain-containing protein [Actinoplanes aksuensis]MCO8270671.1 cupin domain-containing protein [Actinoplanes aksuensis]